ncbi:tumor necrosis factor receptor superfamily member 11A [Salmo salar]|uniref:Tumor necrosis factor receptor superfamily member 11A n=1 Tax=Salmo salar TaxID=8030 RepID=A0ABM3E638_SALSA|nr:tumor necrosis factor receptor superfamily member 11A-like [Salmo salar]
MRVHFSTCWIFQGWIIHLVLTLCTQRALSRPTCSQQQYLKEKRCCSKCEPGSYVFAECAGYSDTKCRPCGSDEYQPDWTNETKCLPQKFCDTGKGFNRVRPSNRLAAVPCQCKPGLQCSPINCEFCEKIPSCGPGYGLETDTESGRRTCVACKRGHFSPNTSMEPCSLWTNCNGLGKSDKQTGSDQTDAVCGPPLSGASTSWLLLWVLSVITVLCLLILLLFCYKEKLRLLSVNLRSCVQNLKRTRIQQETLAPLYHSRVVEGGLQGQSGTLHETTCLIGLAHSPSETTHTCPTATPGDRVKLPPTKEMEEERKEERREEEDEGVGSEGSGEAEEVSEDGVCEEVVPDGVCEEVVPEDVCVSPLWAGSCVCVLSVREPLEVGDNEDCSQAVNPGTLGTCSCGGEGESKGGREGRALRGAAISPPPSPSLPPPPLSPPDDRSCDLYPPLTQVRSEIKGQLIDSAQGKGEELYRLDCSISSTPTTKPMPPLTSTISPYPSMTSVTVGDRQSELTSEASSSEQNQGLSWRDSGGNKVSSGGSELDCAPESLQSQLTEPALTSGQVTGNNNTTFISSGQVMNFNADVIVVYVSQTSLGNEGEGPDDVFGSPVQEQANESAPMIQSSISSKSVSHSSVVSSVNSITHNPLLQEDNLPVQEVTDQWPREN